jgi:hypothetical protein
MSTVIKWNASASREVAPVGRPKWREVRQGLALAIFGNMLFLGPGVLGLLLLGPLADRASNLLGFAGEDVELLAKVMLAFGAGVGYLLVLVGQWLCLTAAPQGHSAKDLQFACLLCSILILPCFVAALSPGGTVLSASFRDGRNDLGGFNPLHPGVLLQIVSLVLGLLSILLFSGFTRALSRCLGGNAGNGGLTVYFWFVAFLLGGSVGVILQVRRYVPPHVLSLLLLLLGVSWLVSLLWHVLILSGTARQITRFLRQRQSRSIPIQGPMAWEKGQVVLHAAEFLHKKS